MKIKNKKNIKFLLLLVSIFIILSNLNKELKASSLKVVTFYNPPFIYEENHVLKGFSVDVVNRVFKKMNQKIKIVIEPSRRAQSEVQNGKSDAIFTLFKNKEREAYLDFIATPIVAQNHMAFFVRQNTNIKFDGNFDNINPNTVGIVRGVNYGPIFSQAVLENKFSTEECNDNEKCVLKLRANRTKIIIGNEIVIKFLMNKLKIKQSEFKKLNPRIESIPSYLAFTKKKNLIEIKKRFEATLNEMKENGEYDEIAQKWDKIISIK